MPNDWITTAEVAERLDVDVSTVARWVRSGALAPSGKLPGLRGAYLFEPGDVDAFAAERGAA
jgi:excisionase family DNA binding protein